MQVDVIAVHNTVGDVKPLWILRSGKKSKIEKINHVIKSKDVTLYNCVCGGEIVVLSFDGIRWMVD